MVLEHYVSKEFRDTILLIFLYVLQGIPSGLSASIPLVLQSDHDYHLQAIFSWSLWPYSLKLLWAPIVDAVYVKRIGRRKSWLVPLHACTGITLLGLAARIHIWLGHGDSYPHSVLITPLTCAFFFLALLTATSETVVDAWGISMLSSHNVSLAATCNSLGQSLGYVISFLVFVVLGSPEVCKKFLHVTPASNQGIICYSGFLNFCGVIYLITAFAIAIFNNEQNSSKSFISNIPATNLCIEKNTSITSSVWNLNRKIIPEIHHFQNEGADIKMLHLPESGSLSLKEIYGGMWRIICLKPVQLYTFWLFTITFPFAACDRLFPLRLIDLGVPKQKMGILMSLVVPLSILVPLTATRWSTKNQALKSALIASIPRALVSFLTIPFIYLASSTSAAASIGESKSQWFGTIFQVGVLLILGLGTLLGNAMGLSQMSFNARISDPLIGATYMTLLGTLASLAGRLPDTLVLYFVDVLSFDFCQSSNKGKTSCTSPVGRNACVAMSGVCVSPAIDGYSIQVATSFLLFLIMFFLFLGRWTQRLDANPINDFRINFKATF